MENTSFLRQIAQYVHDNFKGKTQDLTIVFPNRRAGIFLLQHLSSLQQGPGWAPEVVSLEQFASRFTRLRPADSLILSFHLYASYKECCASPLSFERFYPWAEVLLKDFDELDKQCIDAKKLFGQIADFKALEQDDYLTDQQRKAIAEFWGAYHKGDKKTEAKEKFLYFWNLLPELYQKFQERLNALQMGYSGMISRQAAELVQGQAELQGTVLFCGFNALTKAEELLISALVKQGRGTCLWDFDEHMLKAEQESGMFMRRWMKHPVLKESFQLLPRQKESQLKQKHVRLVELPLEHIQAKAASSMLDEQVLNSCKDASELVKTAMVMPDESQLFPLLYNLPENLQKLDAKVNVTMGVPLRITPVYSLLENALALFRTAVVRGEETYFYYDPVVRLLRHAYIRGLYPKAVQEILSKVEYNNLVYIKAEMLDRGLLSTVFPELASGISRKEYLLRLLDHISLNIKQGEANELTLEAEYLVSARVSLERLFENAELMDIQLDEKLMEQLIRQMLQQLKIPFVGEPLDGLQLMGMLETRCLDFENLFLLSANEGVMPSSGKDMSFIPYYLRSTFGLQTSEQKDAVYAYNFYRLLKHAKNIYIYYATTRKGGESGELSRFIQQLKHEVWQDLTIETRNLEAKLEGKDIDQLPDKQAFIEEFWKRQTNRGEVQLSPSALDTYLSCRLKFGYRYLLGLKETNEVTTEVDHALFGQLLHMSLELFYAEIGLDKEITAEVITDQLNKKPAVEWVQRAAKELQGEGMSKAVGVEASIVAELMEQILRIDLAQAPFTIRALEQKCHLPIKLPTENGELLTVKIGGVVDRVDEKEGKLRVVDYKSGRDSREFLNIESLFTPEDKDRNKSAMQTLLYSLMYKHDHPVQVAGKALVPTVYNRKDLYEDGFDGLLLQKDASPLQQLDEERGLQVEESLRGLVREIFSPDQLLTPTEDKKVCEYCPYAGMCNHA